MPLVPPTPSVESITSVPFMPSILSTLAPPLRPPPPRAPLDPHTLSSLISTPTELLLDICRDLGTVDLWNLAQAAPFRFLSESFNIYYQEPQYQVQAQRNPPMVETEQTRPLLIYAIENGFSTDIIQKIAEAYRVVYPDALNSIWGELYRQIPPPLVSAIRVQRPDVVNLLLHLGADPRIRYAEEDESGMFKSQGKCNRIGYPHATCWDGNGPTHTQYCDDALRGALRYSSTQPPTEYARHRRCVDAIFAYGIRIKSFRVADEVTLEFKLAAEQGFIAEIKASIEDEIIDLPRDDSTRLYLLDKLFRVVLTLTDGQRELIEYLIGLGSPTYLSDGSDYADMIKSRRPLNAALIRKARAAYRAST